jgi:hypothetical protein
MLAGGDRRKLNRIHAEVKKKLLWLTLIQELNFGSEISEPARDGPAPRLEVVAG